MRFQSLRLLFVMLLFIGLSVCSGALPAGAAVRPGTTGHYYQAHAGRVAPLRRVGTSTVPQAHGHEPVASASARYATFSPGGQPGSAAQGGAITIAPPTRSPANTTIYASFAGQSDTTFSPDAAVDVAPGRSDLVQTTASQWAAYGFGGNLEYSTSLFNWFGMPYLTTPRVIYDPWGGRFIMAVDSLLSGGILVSVSQQSGALGNWCTYTLGTADHAADLDIGVDYRGIYLTTDFDGQTFYNEIFNVNRSQMESCQSAGYWYWTNVRNPDGSYAFSIAPSVAWYLSSTQYMVDASVDGGCSLTLWTMSGSSLANHTIPTLCYSPASFAQQKGTSDTIATGGNVISQASYQDGLVDVALTGSYNWGNGNSNSVVWWFKIDPVDQTLVQQGGFGTPGSWYFDPAMQQDTDGNAVIAYDASSASYYPGVAYVMLTPGGGIESNYWLWEGSTYYSFPIEDEGDYLSAALDDNYSGRFWITGQYPNANHDWSTWIGEVSA